MVNQAPSRFRNFFLSLLGLTVIFSFNVVLADDLTPAAAVKVIEGAKLEPISSKEIGLLKTLDANYQKQSAEMKVIKTTKIPLLNQERKLSGYLWISTGRMRMELEGAEKTLLVVNKKNLWAVTYPPAEFKDAAVQVIKADTSTKKGRSQNFVALLSQGGFLKFFNPTGIQKYPDGEVLFYLSPKQELTDFKRAQVRVSKDGKKIIFLNYWDDRDNETRLEFSDVKFQKKILDKLFTFSPPANADVLGI